MKDKYLITNITIGILFIINIIIIIILKNLVDDKTLMINGYKSDRNVCRREFEELTDNYNKLTEKYDKLNLSKN